METSLFDQSGDSKDNPDLKADMMLAELKGHNKKLIKDRMYGRIQGV